MMFMAFTRIGASFWYTTLMPLTAEALAAIGRALGNHNGTNSCDYLWHFQIPSDGSKIRSELVEVRAVVVYD